MNLRLCSALAAALALAAASPAQAQQDASTLRKDMIGQWELATTERSKTCVVTLKPDAAPQGLKLELEPGCAAALHTVVAPLVLAAPACSQDAAGLKKGMIGQWELSTTERSKTCVVTMKGDATPQGPKLEL